MQLNAITRKSALAAMVLLVVVLVVAMLRFYFSPFATEVANSAYFERTVSLVVSTMIFLCVGFVETKMLMRSGLNKGYCTLPMPLYGVLACGIFVAPNTLSTALVSLCLALAIYLLLRSLHSAGERDSVFFASLLLGIMVLLYPPSILFVLIIPLSIFALALSFRQFVLMVSGYLLPIFAASYVMWYCGGGFLDLSHNIVEALLMPRMSEMTAIPYVATLMIAIVIVILLWGLIYSFVRPDKLFMLTRIRRALHLFVWVMIMTLAMLFIPACDLSVLAIMAVPATILLSLALSLLPNNHSTIAYWVLLALFVLHLFIE